MPTIQIDKPTPDATVYAISPQPGQVLVRGKADASGVEDSASITLAVNGVEYRVTGDWADFQATVQLATPGNIAITATLHWLVSGRNGEVPKSISTTTNITFVYDTTAPTVTIESPTNLALVPIDETGGGFELRVNAQDVGVGVDPARIEWNLDGHIGTSFTPIDGSAGDFAARVDWLARLPVPSEQFINVLASDLAGNRSEPVALHVFATDRTSPYFEIIARAQLYRVGIGQSLVIDGVARDRQSGLFTLEWRLDGGSRVLVKTWDPPIVSKGEETTVWSLTVPADSLQAAPPRNPHMLDLYFTDRSGNVNTTTLQVEVLRRIIPLDATDLVGAREYLRALLAFLHSHVRISGTANAFVDNALLSTTFGQNFTSLSTSLSDANVTPINQARLCVEILRSQLSLSLDIDTSPSHDYLSVAYEFLLRQVGTTHDELRLIRGADDPRKRSLTKRLGIGDNTGRVDALLLRPSLNLNESSLQHLFALPATGTAGGVTTSSSDGEFFAWQNSQQQTDWAVADSQRTGLLIDPDVIRRADLVGDASSVQLALLKDRRAVLAQRESDLRARLGAGAPLQTLRALVADAFPAWEGSDALERLDQLLALADGGGRRIDPALAAAGLDMSALRRLTRVAALARAARDASDMVDADFEDVIQILMRVWKVSRFTKWRAQERLAAISVSPAFFRLDLDGAPLLASTGFQAGAAIPAGNDARAWTVTSPDGAIAPAKVVHLLANNWVPHDDSSRWINPTGDGTAALPAGEYVYTTTIDLDGWDLSTLELVARVAVDDKLTAISITSPEVTGVVHRTELGVGTYTVFIAVAIDATQLFEGINQIAFHTVNANAAANPAGFRAELLLAGQLRRASASAWRRVTPTPQAFPPPEVGTGRSGVSLGGEDSNWRLVSAPSGVVAPAAAIVCAATPAGWLDNARSSRSRWIAPLSDGNAPLPAGDYVYETSLDLTGWRLNDMSLELHIAADDVPVELAVTSAGGRQSLLPLTGSSTAFAIVEVDGAVFDPGVNTLRVRVRNAIKGSTGVRLEVVYLSAPVLQTWVPTPALRDEWQALLSSRIEEVATRVQGRAEIVQAADKLALPILRDGLIRQYARSERLTPSEAAEWLGQRYLVETRGEAWRMTTRVLQATESLQTLVDALREHRLSKDHPAFGWQLANEQNKIEQFDEEWSWMGSYAAWRSATLVFCYPENLLLPSLRDSKERTVPFNDFILNAVRSSSRLNRATAEEKAKAYISALGAAGFAVPASPDGKELLTARRNDAELERFRSAMKTAWDSNADPVRRTKLDEILWCVPLTLALHFQRWGDFEAALDWFRLVYAHQAQSDEQRKVYPGLGEERNGPPTLDRGDFWLREALNPHSFARQRWPLDGAGHAPAVKQANPYTRFTMMCVARCLLDFADSEFARDSGESLANARGLYLVARDVMSRADFDDVQPKTPDQVLLPNPILGALRARTENQLRKMRQGRNAAGMKRDLEPPPQSSTLSGAPALSSSGAIVLATDRRVDKATPYRFAVLMDRAKQLVGIAQQMEGAYLVALEKLDAENYNLKKAGFDLDLATAGMQLQKLRVVEATASRSLAQTQRSRATTQKQRYQGWIDQGLSASEQMIISQYVIAGASRATAAIADAVASIAQMTIGVAGANVGAGAAAATEAATVPAVIVRALATGTAAEADAAAQVNGLLANQERRAADWTLARDLADIDEQISDEQSQIASDHVNVASQEQVIATLQQSQAVDMARFLATKFTSADLYEWMSGVLGGVYSFFLQQATATAALAQQQLGFERQESPGRIIQNDYWELPADPGQTTADSSKKDRRGLTGSARLLQDLYQLDQFAFDANKRRLNLSHTLSLSQLNPQGFAMFRQTGVLNFVTTQQQFDDLFPGHYLRLIKRVRTSVVALVPPTAGVRASLRVGGVSTVVTGGDTFQEVTIRRDSEYVALSSPTNATGVFELDAQLELLMPFESMGVATTWEFGMPQAANPFDFNSVADVLVTIEYTALNDDDYRRQVIQRLPRQAGANRAVSVRDDLPDVWYALRNPDPAVAPAIRFNSERRHFPPNLQGLATKDLVFALVTSPGSAAIDGEVTLTYAPDGVAGTAVPASALLVDNRISTLTSAASWRPLVASKPVTGQWAFALSAGLADAIIGGNVSDILVLQSFEGTKPAWPVS